MIIKAETLSNPDLTPWAPTPTQIPENWMKLANKLAQQAKGSPHPYVLDVKYNSQRVGDQLRSWGLPWQVVMAGYLWEYDNEQIRYDNLDDVDCVINHITYANLYTRYIKDENLPPLLTPPYEDLGALLIAVAIYYQALQVLEEQSKDQPYTKTMQSNIGRVGRTLLNITKRLGMWHFKRDIEDLIEQLHSPVKFVEIKREYEGILEQDAIMLEDTRQLFTNSYFEATQRHITILCTECGVSGLKRRMQDERALAALEKPLLTCFDLTTFDIIVSTFQECYAVFGVLSQLGYIQDHVIDQIANPKSNGYSHLAFVLTLKPQATYTHSLKWPESYTRVCHIQIATHLMHAITWYGCLHPNYYLLHTKTPKKEKIEPLPLNQLWWTHLSRQEEGQL